MVALLTPLVDIFVALFSLSQPMYVFEFNAAIPAPLHSSLNKPVIGKLRNKTCVACEINIADVQLLTWDTVVVVGMMGVGTECQEL